MILYIIESISRSPESHDHLIGILFGPKNVTITSLASEFCETFKVMDHLQKLREIDEIGRDFKTDDYHLVRQYRQGSLKGAELERARALAGQMEAHSRERRQLTSEAYQQMEERLSSIPGLRHDVSRVNSHDDSVDRAFIDWLIAHHGFTRAPCQHLQIGIGIETSTDEFNIVLRLPREDINEDQKD